MTSSPPRLATWALTLLLTPADRDLVLGDLWGEFHEHVAPVRGPGVRGDGAGVR